MMLHIELFFTNEHSFDELIEVFVLMRNKLLDLARLGVCNDLIFNYFAVGQVREHQR